MKKIIVMLMIAVLGLGLLAGCTNQAAETRDVETIKIGYIGPLTGDVAVLGIDASKSIELAVAQANANGGINGKQIELFIEDDMYDTVKTVSAYNKLVHTQGVETIIVSTYGGLFAIAEQAKKDGVLVVDSLDCDDNIANQLPENTFCVAKETNDLADVIANYAIEQGYENIGVIHSNADEFMPSVARRFTEVVSSKGINVNAQAYNPGSTDFKSQLLKFKDVDAIVYLGYDEIGLAMRQARDLGIDKPALTIPTVATTPSIQENSQGAINGIYFSFYAPLENNVAAQQFHKDFENAYGRTPYVFVASDHAYDAANILLKEVLPNVDGRTITDRLTQKIENMHDVENYNGVSGKLTMDADGSISGILIRLYQLQNLTPVYIQG